MTYTISDYIALSLVDNAGDPSVDMSDDVVSLPINLTKTKVAAVQIAWTGTPVGDFTLEASCDPGLNQLGEGVVNWETIADTTVAAGGAAGTQMWNFLNDFGFNWMRLVYTSGSSTGTLDLAQYNGKG